jgi:diacylglycerol kinase family enzyme
MRVIALLNAAAGQNAGGKAAPDGRADGARAREVREALAEAGVDAEVRGVDGKRLTEAARRAVAERPDAVVAAGGDGTVSAVASAVAGSDVPMGVIAMGTLNHFAKDLRLPLDVREAARVIAAGNVARVDAARVNGHVFVNNSSIGLYPHVVRQRDDIRERLGRGKWWAMLESVLALFRWFPTMRVRVSVNAETFLRTTPFVFVGNNQYRLDLFSLGQREQLDRGELCLYFTNRTGRTGLLRLALRAIFGKLSQDRDFNALCAQEVWVDAPKRRLAVALDGEVFHMRPPLHFESWRHALKVLVAPGPPTG